MSKPWEETWTTAPSDSRTTHVFSEDGDGGHTLIAKRLPPEYAHLIAAAPELYRALEKVVQFSRDPSMPPEWRRMLQNAIVPEATLALRKSRGEK